MPDLNLRSPTVPLRPTGADGYRVPRPDYDLSLSYGRESRRALFEPLAKVTDALVGLQMHQAQTEAEAIAQKQINSQQEELNQQFTELQTLKMQDAIEGGKKFKQSMADMMRKQNEANAESQPLIRNAVQKASDDLRLSYGAKVDAYVMQETFNFKNSEMLSAIELTTNDLITNYNNPELRQKYTAKLINQQGMQLDFNGINKGTKAYEVGIMNTLDKAHKTVINDMINLEKFGEAKSAIDKAFSDNQMTAATRNDLLARLFDASQNSSARRASIRAANEQWKYYNSLYKLTPAYRDATYQKAKQDYLKENENHYKSVEKEVGGVLQTVLIKKSEDELNAGAEDYANLMLANQQRIVQRWNDAKNAEQQDLAKRAIKIINEKGKVDSPQELFSSKEAYQQAVAMAVEDGRGEDYYYKMVESFNKQHDQPNIEAGTYLDGLTNEQWKSMYPTTSAFNEVWGDRLSPTQMETYENKRSKIIDGDNRTLISNTIKPANFTAEIRSFGIDIDNKGNGKTSTDKLMIMSLFNDLKSKAFNEIPKGEVADVNKITAIMKGIVTNPAYRAQVAEQFNSLKTNMAPINEFFGDPYDYQQTEVVSSELEDGASSDNEFIRKRSTIPDELYVNPEGDLRAPVPSYYNQFYPNYY